MSELLFGDAELLEHRVKHARLQLAGLNGGPSVADTQDLMAAFAARRFDAEREAAGVGPHLRGFCELLPVHGSRNRSLCYDCQRMAAGVEARAGSVTLRISGLANPVLVPLVLSAKEKFLIIRRLTSFSNNEAGTNQH